MGSFCDMSVVVQFACDNFQTHLSNQYSVNELWESWSCVWSAEAADGVDSCGFLEMATAAQSQYLELRSKARPQLPAQSPGVKTVFPHWGLAALEGNNRHARQVQIGGVNILHGVAKASGFGGSAHQSSMPPRFSVHLDSTSPGWTPEFPPGSRDVPGGLVD